MSLIKSLSRQGLLEKSDSKAPKEPHELTSRRIYVNAPLSPEDLTKKKKPKAHFPSNKIITSKYTVISFIPKNLFEQFRRLANAFFLLIVILQFFTLFETINPVVSGLPLFIILLMTAGKDGFEDWKRHLSDKQINNHISYTVGGSWKNVNYSDDKSWEEYCELAWEKLLEWIQHLRGKTKDAADSSTTSSSITIPSILAPEPPEENEELEKLSPQLVVNDVTNAQQSQGQSQAWQEVDKIQQQGKVHWKKTPWQKIRVGDIIYLRDNDPIPADILILSTSEPDCLCYVETKNLDGETNLKIRRGLAETAHLQTPQDCCTISMMIESEGPNCNLYNYQGTAVYFQDGGEIGRVPITINQILLRGCILRNTDYVIGIVLFNGKDTKISLNTGSTPSKRSMVEKEMNLQIALNLFILFIMCVVCAVGFRFWTPPLTAENVPYLPPDVVSDGIDFNAFITFWLALIAFQNLVPVSLYLTVEIVKTIQAYFIYSDVHLYHENSDTPCVPISWNLSEDLGQIEYIFSDKTGTLTCNIMEFKRCSIGGHIYSSEKKDDEELTESNAQMLKATPKVKEFLSHQNPRRDQIVEFFTHLAVCHTVLASYETSTDINSIQYKAQSPDEAALVKAAKENGFVFLGRELTHIHLNILGEDVTYNLLNVLEFDSKRKRMSVILQLPNDDIILYCKGADNVIYDLLKPNQREIKNKTSRHLELFASEGLRTLCVAYARIEKNYYEDWAARYDDACSTYGPNDPTAECIAAEIEKELILIGATAIEDRLQDGVPESISKLSMAGIKIWVLTGDKLETAISIGFSCNLLTRDMNLFILKGERDSNEMIKEQIENAHQKIEDKNAKDRPGKLALVIDGPALKYALSDDMKQTFLKLSCECDAVVCCRVSPLQKAKVVELVKHGKGVMTLAIGDGANDVSMIQAANIGIGIAGEEGLQAVMASDYVLARFRFLSRLLIVHGKWSYRRISEMVFNYFYKNNLWVGILFWFVFYSGYSTQTVYDFTYMLFYNLLFSSLPVIVLGVYDQDVNAEISMLVPSLYRPGLGKYWFSLKRFAYYMVEGFYQSLVCFYVAFAAYGDGPSLPSGKSDSINTMGTTMAITAITCVNIFVGINTRNWTWITWFSLLGSISLIHIYILIYANQNLFNGGLTGITGIPEAVYGSLVFWATVPLCLLLSLAPRCILFYIQNNYIPMDMDIAREFQKYNLDTKKLEQPPPIPPSGSVGDMSVLRSRGTSLAQSPRMTMLSTGDVFNNRGFVFSHEVGMRDIMMGAADVTRRRSFELPSGWRMNTMATVRRFRTVPSLLGATQASHEKLGLSIGKAQDRNVMQQNRALSDPNLCLTATPISPITPSTPNGQAPGRVETPEIESHEEKGAE